MRAVVLIAMLGLLPVRPIFAEKPAPIPIDVADEGAPTFTVYSSREGLSDEIWSTVGFDKHGFVWAGSASSLARFDGYRWKPWPFPEARSLVRDMQADAQGNLWAIFEREGLARYDGSAWSLVPGRNEFRQRFSDTRRADGTAEFWVSQDNGFQRLNGNHWVDDPGNGSVRLGPAARIEQTQSLFGHPRQWMGGTTDGLWYRPIDNSNNVMAWKRFEEPGLNSLHVTDMLVTHDGEAEELWILTYGDGLIRIRNDGIRIWRAADGELPSEAIYSARATYTSRGERTLWLASRAGLLRIRNDRLAVFDRRNGLPSDAVRGLKLQRNADGTELLWLATEGGIARTALTRSQWQTVSLLGARENGVFTALLEPDDKGGERLWVGSPKQGLALLEDAAWHTFTVANGKLPVDGVRQLWRLPDANGRPQRLLSLVNGQLIRIDDALNFIELKTPWPQSAEEIAAIAVSRKQGDQHETWIGNLNSGIYRLAAGRWTQFLADGAKQPWSVIGLTEQIDAGGRSWLWAASNQGLAVFDGRRWTLIKGLPTDSFRGVTVVRRSARPELWASSSRNGVVRLDVTDPAQPVLITDDRVPDPPDPTVYSVVEDSKGRLYVCTNNGVQQLARVGDQDYSERVFRRRDGLVHDECNTNAQFVDANDRYWVGTLGGLSVYDPNIRMAERQAQPRPLRFTELVVDGASSDPEGRGEIAVPAGARDLAISYSVLSGLREQESTYRSQLIGFDEEPGAWTTEHLRRFTRLAPGSYELRIEGRDFAGTASAQRSLHFSVGAFWWEEPVVRVLLALLLIAVTAGLVLAYNRGLRARQKLLKREVARRTLEIRAANERLTELSYRDPLTGVANRRRLMEAMAAAIERSMKRSLPIGLIVIDVDHFKDYNDRHGHLAGDVALRAVAQALESATREQDLVARFGGEEFACLLIDADMEVVARCAERMRALVEALPPRMLGNSSHGVTISAGILSRVPGPGDHAADLLRDADRALYRAKHEGRNCVRRAGDPGESPAAD